MKQIEFTEDDIVTHGNALAVTDIRIFPKTGKGAEYRTGKCDRCGKPSGPYFLCKKHREHGSVKRVIDSLVKQGEIIRITNGRGKKGGAKYKKKPGIPYVRDGIKQGRNDPCECGSGHKYKKCCG